MPPKQKTKQNDKKIKNEDRYYLAPSKIHGLGVFANRKFKEGEVIDLGIQNIFGLIPSPTPKFGSYINHQLNCNTVLKPCPHGYYVVASKEIRPHVEITIDYNNTPWFISKPNPTW